MLHLTIINMLLTNGPYVPSLLTFILIVLMIPNQPINAASLGDFCSPALVQAGRGRGGQCGKASVRITMRKGRCMDGGSQNAGTGKGLSQGR